MPQEASLPGPAAPQERRDPDDYLAALLASAPADVRERLTEIGREAAVPSVATIVLFLGSQPGGYGGPRLSQHLGLEHFAVRAGDVHFGDVPGYVVLPEPSEEGGVVVLLS